MPSSRKRGNGSHRVQLGTGDADAVVAGAAAGAGVGGAAAALDAGAGVRERSELCERVDHFRRSIALISHVAQARPRRLSNERRTARSDRMRGTAEVVVAVAVVAAAGADAPGCGVAAGAAAAAAGRAAAGSRADLSPVTAHTSHRCQYGVVGAYEAAIAHRFER